RRGLRLLAARLGPLPDRRAAPRPVPVPRAPRLADRAAEAGRAARPRDGHAAQSAGPGLGDPLRPRRGVPTPGGPGGRARAVAAPARLLGASAAPAAGPGRAARRRDARPRPVRGSVRPVAERVVWGAQAAA